MTEQALSLYPGLLRRAEELSGSWSRAEDLVQDVYVAFCTKPSALIRHEP